MTRSDIDILIDKMNLYREQYQKLSEIDIKPIQITKDRSIESINDLFDKTNCASFTYFESFVFIESNDHDMHSVGFVFAENVNSNFYYVQDPNSYRIFSVDFDGNYVEEIANGFEMMVLLLIQMLIMEIERLGEDEFDLTDERYLEYYDICFLITNGEEKYKSFIEYICGGVSR